MGFQDDNSILERTYHDFVAQGIFKSGFKLTFLKELTLKVVSLYLMKIILEEYLNKKK